MAKKTAIASAAAGREHDSIAVVNRHAATNAATTRRRYGRRVAQGETSVDPATRVPQAAPNFGRVPLPQIITFSGMQSTISHVYKNPDAAIRHSIENAGFMRLDPAIMEPLEARQRMTALLNWSLEPEDPKDPRQKELVADLTACLEQIKRFTEYRRNLMEAVWCGRTAIQNRWEWRVVRGQRRQVIRNWTPVNGDKLAFRFDDGSGKYDPDQIGIRVGGAFNQHDALAGDRVIESTEFGQCYFLEPWERTLFTVHKHMIEDGAFEDPMSAGRIHGVGVRDRIYWCWFQKQETMAQLMEVIQRTGTGFTIYYYQDGNPAAKREMEEVALNQAPTNAILIPRTSEDPSMNANGIDRIEPSTAGITAMKEIIGEFFGWQIKRYILGQTLSSEPAATGLGSGVADLQQDTVAQIVQYDAVNLEETISDEVVEPLKNYNHAWARDIRVRFKINTKDNEAEKKLSGFKQAWDMGCKLKAQDVMDVIGASMPDQDDEVLQNPAMQQQQRLWEQAHPQEGDIGQDGGVMGADGQPAEEGSVEDQFGPLAGLLGQGGQDQGGAGSGGDQPPGGGGGPGGPGPGSGGPPQRFAKQVRSSPGQKPLFHDETSRQHAQKWKEELHPRDDGGQFAEKGSGHKSTATEAPGGIRAKQAASSPGQRALQLAGDAAEQVGMPTLPAPGGDGTEQPFALSGKPVRGKTTIPGSGATKQRDLFAGRGDAPGQMSFADDMDPAAKNVPVIEPPEKPLPDDHHLERARAIVSRIPKVSAKGLAVQLNGEVSEEHAAELLEKLRGGASKPAATVPAPTEQPKETAAATPPVEESPSAGAAATEPESPISKFRPDVEIDSIFASGQKRSREGRLGFGPKSISAAALKGTNAIWYHQGDPNQTRFNAAQKDAHESTVGAAAEMEAALKAGYIFKNYRAGKLGTAWVLEKDGRVLTDRGAKELLAGRATVNVEGEEPMQRRASTVKSLSAFIKSLPESTRGNLGALSAAINRSPLGDHVTLSRGRDGMLKLSDKDKTWHLSEPSGGHDAQGEWHRNLESHLPRFIAKLDHMATTEIPEGYGGWAAHDRQADTEAVKAHPPGGGHSPAVQSAIAAAHEQLHAAGLAEKPEPAAESPTLPAPDKPPEKPTSPFSLADVAAHHKAMRAGEANAAQLREWFDHYTGDQSAIRAELEGKKVGELKEMGAGGWHAVGMKKAELVDDLVNKIAQQYHVGESFIYQPHQESSIDALRRHVHAQTDEHVKQFVDRHAAAQAERKERTKGAVKAIENPETLEEFRLREKYKAPPLTPEQQAKYDHLAATDRREKDKAKKSTVSAFRPGSEATGEVGIVEGHHQKRNAPTYTVTVENRLGDNWDEALSRAKRMGGNYVNAVIAKRYGATPGFQFFDKKSAEDFAKVLGGESADTSEQVEQRRIESIENASDRLAAMAENTHAAADSSLNADRKTNTSKRAEQAAYAESAARNQKALAETMERLSGAMKNGEAPHLEGIRHGSHVSELNSQLRRARWARMQAEGVHKKPHDEYENFKDKPPEVDDVKHADYPYPAIWASQLREHAAEFANEPGLMKISQRLAKTAAGASPFKKTVGKMTTNGGTFVSASELEHKELAPHLQIRGVKEGQGVRVHRSTDWKLEQASEQAGKGHKVFHTADGGKSWGTTPEIAIAAALNRGHELDVADLPQDQLLKITDSSDIADLATAAKRLRRHSNRDLRRIGDDLTGRIESYKRMQAMDIKSPGELRAALRDFLPLRTKPEGESKIKKMERDLIGKKIEGFFPTPQPLVERMLDAADIQPGHSVLEPSAGKGDILDAIRERHPDATTAGIEPHSSLRGIIEAKGHVLVGSDFTEHGENYDRIVMNPPFERGQDAEHVQHAFERLKPGGRLVAIMSNGPFFRSDKKSAAFRDWLESVDGSHDELPEGSFAGDDAFRKTGVNTRMIVIDKPKE